MFFSLDGLDGAGKSTQMNLFCQWLVGQGCDVLTCRDPGSTAAGEALRSLLLGKSGMSIHSRTEMLMYMAARAQLVEELIRPALQAGKTVVCDRYLLANIVYQGHARGLDLTALRRVGEITVAGLMPRLTFVLDVPVPTAMERMNRELDRMESVGGEFLERVRQGFLAESKVYPAPVVVIDATQSAEAVQQQIRDRAAKVLR